MYILTSKAYGAHKPYFVQAGHKPNFVEKVEDWLERAEVEGEAADQIRDAVTTVSNQSDEVIRLEVDGMEIEIYHEYQN